VCEADTREGDTLARMKKCLFCQRAVDSAEHLWSDWILKDLKPVEPIHVKIGRRTSKWVDNPEVRVKCVCQKCNNSWMSDLENENKPHIRTMMHGNPITLEPKQQRSLTRWAILKGMVLEAAAKKTVPFYTESEKAEIAPPSTFIPVATRAWIGRLRVGGFHAGGTDTYGDINGVPKAFHGCVTTIIVGQLVVQALTTHVLPMFGTLPFRPNYKRGAWHKNLLEVWPVFGKVRWPPPLSFTPDGGNSIGGLINRWKIGTDVG
jgi:hypothetical protein